MKKYIEKLEFNKVLDILANLCITDIGKSLAKNLKPCNNKNIVASLLKETTEATSLIYKKHSPDFLPICDISYITNLLEINGILNTISLLEVCKILKLSSDLKKYYNNNNSENNESKFPILESYFSMLYVNPHIQENIQKSILDEFTISDDASKELFNIRKKQRNLEETIKNKLNSFIHSASYSKYIQENIITIRNDRYVIPVKDEYRSMINGFIHDISSSGSTVFIEPMVVFELNNEMATLRAAESIEIEKILANLSAMLYPIINELKNNYELIGKLDFIFAKAKYSIQLDAIEPQLNDEKQIKLLSARHPLIDKKFVVPIDIHLGINFSTLVITGPNTGGKTVTLKTVGLLTLMACSGLHIPVKTNSSIHVFDEIYADIGDEQSIVESLSTFSSHMHNIINILSNCTSNSLVLLDELCSGTDPIEGSSLAISILEYFFKKHTLTIATTHYQEIKNYALITKGFENASSEFDLENLKPTYKLLIGIPGKSNAFAISKKLGLDETIIARASTFINNNDVSVEELLKNIYDDKIKIEKEKKLIEQNLAEAEVLKKSLQEKNDILKQKELSIIENAKFEARKILLEAKEEVSNSIQEIAKTYEHLDNNNSIKTLNNLRNNLNTSIKNTNTKSLDPKTEDDNILISKDDISIGMMVYIKNLKQDGIVTSLVNKSNKLQVQIGNAKLMVSLSDIAEANNSVKKSFSTTSYKTNKSRTLSSEINVIGYNVEEAIFAIDKYLDDCSLSKLNTVRIVHGKGTGTLRNGIHTFLKKNSHVKTFRLGTFGEGEMGVTIVELK